MKTAPFADWLGWKLIIFMAKRWELIAQQIELQGIVHVDAHECARPIPDPFRQALCIGNRLIEMHRRHVKTVPLPMAKDLGKLCAVETTRHDCRDELRKFCHANPPAPYFFRELAQNHRRRVEIAFDFYRVNGLIRLTGRVEAKVIYR